MAPVEVELAYSIIKHQFGEIVANVLRIVCENPKCTLREITIIALRSHLVGKESKSAQQNQDSVSYKDISSLVKDSLAVLIQHSLISFVRKEIDTSSDEEAEVGEMRSRDIPFVYAADVPVILCRNRLPLYLIHIRRQYGNVGEAVARAFFHRGKLTSFKLFKNALDPLLHELDLTVEDAENCVKDMAKSGILKWVGETSWQQPVENFISTSNDGIDGDVTKCGSKRAREWESNDNLDRDSDDEDKSSERKEFMLVGRGDDAQRVGAPTKCNNKDIWCICYWHLNREFRNECCGFVTQNIVKNDIATKVLWTGLQLSLENEDCEQPTDDFETMDLGTDEIETKLREQECEANRQEIHDAILLLTNQTPQFVIGEPEHAPTRIRFVPGRLVSYARQKTLEEFLNTRYGQIGRRIFRALAVQGGMLEEDVANKCMLHVKVAREHLFRMYNDRVVMIQEVARSHDQQRANNWYYLWKINLLSAYRNMVDIMCKTTLNLFTRREWLQKQRKTSESARKKIETQDAMLAASILRLDQSIMVMNDFGPLTATYFPARYTMTDGIIAQKKKRSSRGQRIG